MEEFYESILPRKQGDLERVSISHMEAEEAAAAVVVSRIALIMADIEKELNKL